MFRYVSCLMLILMLCGILAPAGAAEQRELALTPEERTQWEKRLTPINLGWLPPFAAGELTDDILIGFGCRYAQETVYHSRKHPTVSAGEVDAACRFFFGRPVGRHHSLPGYYDFDGNNYQLFPCLGEGRAGEIHLEALYAGDNGTVIALFWDINPGDTPWPAGQRATKELTAELRLHDIRFYADGPYRATLKPLSENGTTRCILTALEKADQ